jgi:Zn-dependent protease with chaperone function
MNEERWLRLVGRLEARAQANPKRYRRKVVRFAALGYAYIALALVVVLGLAAAVILLSIHHLLVIRWLLPIGALAFVIFRSLAVRIDPPEGIPVSRAEAPAFYDAIDEINRAVRGPSLHAVLVDDDLNAGVVQVPRFGIFGGRSYLVIGLPLLQAVTPTELRAVLAHELAHLSRRHGRIGVWIYRIRTTWDQLLSSLEEERKWTGAFRRFFEWYVPRFNAHTFPLMRAHEFEADRLAADAVGADALGQALGRLAIAGGFLQTRYWPSVFARAIDQPAPRDAFTQLGKAIRTAAADEDSAHWLYAALQQQPDASDSHPALTRRLDALGLQPDALQLRDNEEERAADGYLADNVGTIAMRLDERWQREIALTWTIEHTRLEAEFAELGALETRVDDLDSEQQVRLAQLTEEHRGREEAVVRYREILARDPDHAPAQFSVGRILLGKGDDAGLGELDRAMDLDPDAILLVCELAGAYLTERGRDADAARYQELAVQRAQQLGDAYAERESFTLGEPVEPAELAPDVERALQRSLAAIPEVIQAHVGLRRLQHLVEEWPVYVVVVLAGKTKERAGRQTLADRLAESIELPGEYYLLVTRKRSDALKRFEEAVSEPVYRRG